MRGGAKFLFTLPDGRQYNYGMDDKKKKTAECGRELTETENFKYFSHSECEYFPCHEGADPDNFNCLFCYCPLYSLGDKCGGSFTYTKKGVKCCTGCVRPHLKENYEVITGKLKEACLEMSARKDK